MANKIIIHQVLVKTLRILKKLIRMELNIENVVRIKKS